MVVPKEVIPKFKPRQTLLSAGHLNKVRGAAIREVKGQPPIKVVATPDAWLLSHEPHFPDFCVGTIRSDVPDWSDHRYFVQLQQMTNSDVARSDALVFVNETFPNSDVVVCQNLGEVSDSHYFSDGQEVVVFKIRDSAVPPQWRHIICLSPGSDVSFCEQSDLYSPFTSDVGWASDYSDLLMSDISGDTTNSDHFYVEGWMYRDQERRLNPWFIIDPFKKTSAFFAVRVTKTGGSSGDESTQCSFTYRVTNLRSDTVLGTNMTPEKRRPTVGMMSDTAPSDYGAGFYDGATFVLWDANESLVASDCT